MKILKNKKGVVNVWIILGIIAIFLGLLWLAPGTIFFVGGWLLGILALKSGIRWLGITILAIMIGLTIILLLLWGIDWWSYLTQPVGL